MKLRHIIAAGAIAGLAAASASAVHAAEPIVLKFAFNGPLTGTPAQKGALPWAAKIKAATDGALDINVVLGISTYANVYDRILNGVADFGFGTFGFIEDQYPGTSIMGQPFLTENSVEAGLGIWRLYARGVLAEEYKRVKPIAMFGFGTTVLFLGRPIAKLDDLKGMKLFVNGRTVGQVIQLTEGVPISSNPGALYEGLSRNLAQGAVYSWAGIDQFKIAELVHGAIDLPFGRGGGYFLMNKESFAKLPAFAQQAIDKFSGEEPSRAVGEALDGDDIDAEARIAADPAKFSNIKLSKAERDRLRQVLAPITTEWVARVPNGDKILAAFNEEVARIRKK